MTTKPVTVGVDGSEESLRAAEWAALEAQTACHAAPDRVGTGRLPRLHAYQASPDEIAAALRGIAARALDAAITRCEEVAPGLPIDTGLLSGPPALAVAASGAGASMLVVGARGAGGFAAMMLGSVSRYVASHAPCPVVVVREETMALHREIAVGIRDPEDPTGRWRSRSRRRRCAARTWSPSTPGTGFPPRRTSPARTRPCGRRTTRADLGRGGPPPGGRAGAMARQVPGGPGPPGRYPRTSRPGAGQLLRARRPGGDRQARPSRGPGPRHRLDPARRPRPRPRPGRRRPVRRLTGNPEVARR